MTQPQTFRLMPGGPGPLQQSRVSCGSACLTVARMMIDAALTRWIVQGVGSGGERDSGTVAARFADYEQQVLARTNRVAPWPGSLQPPWPHSLGTPPWGAMAELENGAALPGTPYAMTMLRHRSGDDLADLMQRLLARVGVGAPLLLYVGNATLPRHITLVFVAEQGMRPTLYDPGSGRVGDFPSAALVGRRLGLSGWDRTWLAVHPAGMRPVTNGAEVFSAVRDRMTPAPVADSAWSRLRSQHKGDRDG